MRIIRFALALTYMLIAPLAHGANQEMLRCFLTGRWCMFDDVDPITRVRTRHALVGSDDATVAGANISRPAILLECQNGKPAWWFSTARSFSYGPLGIRYRLDPGGWSVRRWQGPRRVETYSESEVNCPLQWCRRED